MGGKLQAVSGILIESYEDFLKALESGVRFFHLVGGRGSGHAMVKRNTKLLL